MAGFKFYKGRDGMISSAMNFMFSGVAGGYNDVKKKGLEWKTTDGTTVNIVAIGSNNNYDNAKPANPYIALDTPVCCISDYIYEDSTASSVGLTVTPNAASSSATDYGYTTISLDITNPTAEAISFNCVKFLKTCPVAINTTYKGAKTTLIMGYFLDSPYTVNSGDSVSIVLKIKAY